MNVTSTNHGTTSFHKKNIHFVLVKKTFYNYLIFVSMKIRLPCFLLFPSFAESRTNTYKIRSIRYAYTDGRTAHNCREPSLKKNIAP